ncbi:hypothetical protein [Acidaminococcus fermentans]|uniref:hypothetical protein n=1 Tax=Acidaminococcus fermentans TaxID=905 RepID=UPI003079F8EC
MYNIDLVYLWCDGKDENFLERKKRYIGSNKCNTESNGKERFFDNDELKYSLRSVEKYANWIHHIYIVTDRQRPKWFNSNCKKVTIIDHSTILPKELIPCFNSTVIERYIANIPGLSEHFIYGNDDTFFGSEISPDYFFTNQGKPIVKVKKFNDFPYELTTLNIEDVYSKTRFWGKSVINSWKMLMKYWKINRVIPYELHHNFDAYLKSEYKEVMNDYKPIFQQSQERFRSKKDINRILFSIHAVYKGSAVMKIIAQTTKMMKIKSFLFRYKVNSLYVDKKIKSLIVLSLINPDLYCINDSGESNELDNIIEKKLLMKYYPLKSVAEE